MKVRRIKDALLERYLADDLPAELRARIEFSLGESEADRERLDELRADSRAFLVQHPPGPLVARVERTRRRRYFWVPLVLVPVAAAMLFVLAPPKGVSEDEPVLTAKGDLVLAVHKREGEASRPVAPGEVLGAGDAIRFELRAPASGYVAVVGRDSKGTVTVYFPFGGTAAAPYSPMAPLLDQAVELDATPGQEELFAFFGAAPFELASLVADLAAGERDLVRLGRSVPGLRVATAQLAKR